ncbi:hypothetical protein CGMCC3_g8609 [Colletotrichum fructicola]|nr:uncharacterized protein CGMCC3_g8609 [Colletotrichum fructicola]KAE9575334.1 hypothetical protein CGMCC3_g8609 [Colletotrichum fructicola]
MTETRTVVRALCQKVERLTYLAALINDGVGQRGSTEKSDENAR